MLGERFIGQLSENVGGVSEGFIPVSLRSEFFEYPGRKRILLSLGKFGGLAKCLFEKFCHGSTSIYHFQFCTKSVLKALRLRIIRLHRADERQGATPLGLHHPQMEQHLRVDRL